MVIVRHKKTNVLYEYLGDNRYRNTITLKEGTVDEKIAKDVFNINLDATVLLNQYPEIKNLIQTLKLVIETNK